MSATPLRVVAERLRRDLEEAECAYKTGRTSADKLSQLCSYVNYIIDILPQTFGERFYFDTAMIRAMAEDWGGSVALSPMVIPLYGRSWGHGSLLMPYEKERDTHLIDVIFFPGDDRIEAVDLLDYPWLAHELGHYVLFRDDSFFRSAFASALGKRVRSLKLTGIADRGAARVKANAIVDEFRKLWTPTQDHRNWAHELAIDLIAFWTCGPAYLACFEQSVKSMDPFRITQEHPPYAVRADALISCGRRLGFGSESDALAALRADWAGRLKETGEKNVFLALADRELVADCSRAALELCERLGLTRCSVDKVDVLKRTFDADRGDELGVDLLLKAQANSKKMKSAYTTWERTVVQTIAQKVMQLSR